jgi:hypothetical protein
VSIGDGLDQALTVVGNLSQHWQHVVLPAARRFLLLGHPTFLYAFDLPRPAATGEGCVAIVRLGRVFKPSLRHVL